MIKVLQMIGSLNVGGSQTMIMSIYRNIDRSKMQFDFVLDHPNETYFAEDLKALGANIYTMPLFNGVNAGEVKRSWYNFFETHPEYNVLHSHVRSYASLYLPVAKKHGLKTIIHSHNTSNGSGAMALVKDVLQLPLKNQADILMACSTEAGLWLYGEKACKSDKYIFMPNAVDTDRFKLNEETRLKYRRELGFENKLVLGHVGRFSEAKNHGFLIEIFAKVHEKNPNSKLLLIGEGVLQQQASQRAEELGVADDVIMTGNRNDVPELLSAMDLFVFPSKWEGLPVTLIEAQAAGLPCLISNTISLDVDVSPLVTRLPIESSDVWAEEILRGHERKNVKEYIAKAGFDAKASSQTMFELYTKLHNEAKK